MARKRSGVQAFTDRAAIAASLGHTARLIRSRDPDDYGVGRRDTVEVTVYEVYSAFGGSEEGGWWRDVGTVLASRRCRVPRVESVARKLLAAHGYDADYPRSSACGCSEIEIHVARVGRRRYARSVGHYE